MEEYIIKWEEIKEIVRTEHALTDINYNTWVKPLQFFNVENDEFIILIPSDKRQFLKYINDKYLLPFKVAIAEAFQKEYEVKFILEKDSDSYGNETIDNDPKKASYERANLNSKYTFDTFVVGNNNKLAHAAALAIAESPGEVYNPLFLYSGVGLGKTHLMHAIAHYIIENSDKKVLYVTSDTFTKDIVEALKIDKNSPKAMKNFREKYTHIDVLL